MIENRIHVDDSILTERGPDAFKKMVIHEAGHATFQRLLITGEGWTEDANKAIALPDERALEADGRKFYDAWRVLRARPEYFLSQTCRAPSPQRGVRAGSDTWRSSSPSSAADSFMHMALKKNELEAHVSAVPNTETAVKNAWQIALSILKQYEPAILGRNPRPDEDKVRARAYEIDQRSGGGHRTHEETERNYFEALRQIEIEQRAHQIWKLRRRDPVANYYLAERQIAQDRNA